MQIQKITPFVTNQYKGNKKPNSTPISTADYAGQNYARVGYSQIAFGSIYNVQPKKLINIDLEKTKLLKQLDKLLKTETKDSDVEDTLMGILIKALSSARNQLQRELQLLEELNKVAEDKALNYQQKYSKAIQLKKELNKLQKNKTSSKTQKQEKPQDERIDLQLLNKFRSAINNDDFNLIKIFKEYYDDLKNITSISELKERFPKIKTPSNPVDVISKKLADTVTRDFYEEFEHFTVNKDVDNMRHMANKKLNELYESHASMLGISRQEYAERIALPTFERIKDRYLKASLENGFSSIPVTRKNKLAQISKQDAELLNINFDDFVLSVVKKHYLEGSKINEITYSDGKVEIPLSSIKDSDYKFEKIPDKIKGILNTSSTLHSAQRNYNNYNNDQLKSRLMFYANSHLGNNEEILGRIIDFDASSLTKEDVDILKRFLKELDEIADGNISLEQGLENIQRHNYKPTGTEKLNEIEKQKAAEKIKLEQKQNFKLNEIKNNFDNAINILYTNNLNNIANTCLKYRPENLDAKTLEQAEYVIKLINQNIKPDKGLNKTKLEANLMRWDTYIQYKETDSLAPILKKAEQIAAGTNGEIDIDKAGQYIINSEIVEHYPDSLEFVRNKEVLSKIMEKSGYNKDAAISSLSKFDTYQELDESDKKYISKFINIFDTKDAADKTILKHIIENEYITKDTPVQLTLRDNSSESSITATFASEAKKQIADKYKFPLCIDFLKDFEEALSSFATKSNTSGIKYTGKNNNTITYKMELKLMGHDDRLFSSENNYYFDIFSERGLH